MNPGGNMIFNAKARNASTAKALRALVRPLSCPNMVLFYRATGPLSLGKQVFNKSTFSEQQQRRSRLSV